MQSRRKRARKKCPLLRTKGKKPPRILSLSEAAAIIPSRPTIPTLHRWLTYGVRGKRLKGVVIGGRRMIFLKDLEDFLLALNGEERPETEIVNNSSELVSKLLGNR